MTTKYKSFTLFIRTLLVVFIISSFYFAEKSFFKNAPVSSTEDIQTLFVKPDSASNLFVLLIDGLAYRTAMDSTIMPNLNKLRRHSSYSKVKTTFEAYSSSAIRTAFSGSEQNSVFGVLNNFAHQKTNIKSIFSDINDAGLSAAVFSDGHFNQFGEVFIDKYHRDENENYFEKDKKIPAEAITLFNQHNFDVVVAHYETTDWIGHEFGTLLPEYKNAHTTIDSIVGDFYKSLRPTDKLLIMGDHGLNELGEHKTGMDLPTYLSLTGKSYNKDVEFGTINIASIRDVIALSLGLSVNTYHSNIDAVLPAFSMSIDSSEYSSSSDILKKQPNHIHFIFFLAHFVALFLIWIEINAGKSIKLIGYFSLALAAFYFTSSFAIPILLAIEVGILVYLYKKRISETLHSSSFLVNSVLPLCFAIIVGLFPFSGALNTPLFITINLGLVVLSALIMLAYSKTRYTQTDLLIAFLFTLLAVATPFLQKTGFIKHTSFSLGIILLALYPLIISMKSKTSFNSKGLLTVLILISVLLISPYNWTSKVPLLFTPDNFFQIISIYTIGILCKLYLYLKKGTNFREIGFSFFSLGIVLIAELRALDTIFYLPEHIIFAGSVLLFLVIYVVAKKKSQSFYQNTALLTVLFLLLYHTIKVPIYQYFIFDLCLIYLIKISNYFHQNSNKYAFNVANVIPILGVIISASVFVIWTANGIEWRFLYEWFSSVTVEKNVIYFVPFIFAKLLIPLSIIKVLIHKFNPLQAYNSQKVSLYLGTYFTVLVASYLVLSYSTNDIIFFKTVAEITGIQLLMVFGAKL
tara:strand:+ start:340 stop:2748 length:2409 start_codon:yes stop_codon:yes gene_type:complete